MGAIRWEPVVHTISPIDASGKSNAVQISTPDRRRIIAGQLLYPVAWSGIGHCGAPSSAQSLPRKWSQLAMRLLVVEDSERLALLMAKILTDSGHVVDVVENLEMAYAAIKLVEYEVVILDLSLPDGDGRQLLDSLRRNERDVLVLVTTARGDVLSRVQVLDAGADDYIVKPVDGDELIARVRALGRRAGQIQSDHLTFGNVCLDKVSLTLTVADRLVSIPPRELNALSVLMRFQGRVVRREKLDQAIYTFESEVTENATEATISRLRRRMEAFGANIEIVAMRGIGYVLTECEAC